MSAANVPEKNVIDRWERGRVRHSHKHAPVKNVNVAAEQSMTFGERASDAFASTMGSWKFIIIQSIILTIWVALDAVTEEDFNALCAIHLRGAFFTVQTALPYLRPGGAVVLVSSAGAQRNSMA